MLEVEFEPETLSGETATGSVGRSHFKNKPVSLNVPPDTLPVRIALEGTPLRPGKLTIVGCRLSAFGGMSWVQPWEPPETTVGQRLRDSAGVRRGDADARVGARRGSDNESPSPEKGSGQTAPPPTRHQISVYPALPLLELELVDGLAGSDAAMERHDGPGPLLHRGPGPQLALRPLAGQRVSSLALRVANRGKAAAEDLSLAVEPCPPAKGQLKSPPRHRWSWDAEALRAQLPLAPGASLTVDLVLRAAGDAGGEAPAAYRVVAGCTRRVEGREQGEGSSTPRGAAAQVLSRRAALALSVETQPSVVVAAASLCCAVVPVIGGGSEGTSAPDNDRTSASADLPPTGLLLSLDLLNAGPVPLRVWLDCAGGSRDAEEADDASLATLPVPDASELVGPGESVRVRRELDAAHLASLQAEMARREATGEAQAVVRRKTGEAPPAAVGRLAQLLAERLRVGFAAGLPELDGVDAADAAAELASPFASGAPAIRGDVCLALEETLGAVRPSLAACVSPESAVGWLACEASEPEPLPEEAAARWLPHGPAGLRAIPASPGRLVTLRLVTHARGAPAEGTGSFVCALGAVGDLDASSADDSSVFWSGRAKGAHWAARGCELG